MLTLFFQMVFMDDGHDPDRGHGQRWKFSAFVVYGFFVSMFIYPIYGAWVWGGGWLADLGVNFGLGNGHCDFAGSSVVHMTGGVCALAGAWVLGPRIGKFNRDGTANPIPAHDIPMVALGTLILALGWFGFNPGSCCAPTCDCSRRCARCWPRRWRSAMCYMWATASPTMCCNAFRAVAIGPGAR